MRSLMVMMLLSLVLFANTQPYKKDITFEPVVKPSLVKVELDNELYNHTSFNHADVRLHSSKGVEGYFIRPLQEGSVVNQQRLKANLYNREEATLVYYFERPFMVEKIDLHIEDRNFETLIDIYVNGTLLLKNGKVFDYTNETGTQNFELKIPKTLAKEVKVVYHLDQTTSFYKKYQHLRERSKYLTIKSVTFSNTLKAQEVWRRTSIKTEQTITDEKHQRSSYIFNLGHIPFSKISLDVVEQNFKRSGQLYFSKDAQQWQSVRSFNLSASTLGGETQKVIEQRGRTGYLKLVLNNGDNPPLSIRKIRLFTRPTYLYFIANPDEQYALHFGDKLLTEPFYELESLVGSSALSIEGKFSRLKPLKIEEDGSKIAFFENYKKELFMVGILLALGVLGYVAFGLLKRT
jgi:hypothetical protein